MSAAHYPFHYPFWEITLPPCVNYAYGMSHEPSGSRS
jgi:hypothetical protein